MYISGSGMRNINIKKFSISENNKIIPDYIIVLIKIKSK